MTSSSDSMPDTDEQTAKSVAIDVEEIRGPLKETVKEGVREVLSETTMQFSGVDDQSSSDADSSSSLPGFGSALGLLVILLIVIFIERNGLGSADSDETGDEDPSVDVNFSEDD